MNTPLTARFSKAPPARLRSSTPLTRSVPVMAVGSYPSRSLTSGADLTLLTRTASPRYGPVGGVDRARYGGQVEDRRQRGVAAANDRDVLSGIERGVAGRAVCDAFSSELLLAGNAEPARIAACGDDYVRF